MNSIKTLSFRLFQCHQKGVKFIILLILKLNITVPYLDIEWILFYNKIK